MQEEARYRQVFRRVHADHPPCLADEWLSRPCADARGRVLDRPIVWSRRNGPWRRHRLIFVGAAPGNAGGRGSGALGAHGTRIPFGGDLAGANLDALLGSIGLSRNDTFLCAALNQLPAAGGGEPTIRELAAPVGRYPSSIHLLRDTVLAAGPQLVVALGLVASRVLAAALTLPSGDVPPPASLPTTARLERLGIRRGVAVPWPEGLPLAESFITAWHEAWHEPPTFHVLLLTHPSGQNMSPFARVGTAFHTRMVDARNALRRAARDVLALPIPRHRQSPPLDGIYALPEWRELIAPHHARLDALWRQKGI